MTKPNRVKTFHIVHTDRRMNITFDATLETAETKFKSLEQLMMLITRHYLDKGRTEDIKWLLGWLQGIVEDQEEHEALARHRKASGAE